MFKFEVLSLIMKRIVPLVFLFALMFSVSAQTVSNSSFENWATSGLFTQEQPADWTAALVGNVTQQVFGIQVPIPVNTYFGSKSTDAHSGTYALQLNAATVGIPGTDYSYLFPGIAQLGHAEGFEIPLSAITDLVGMIQGGDTTGMGDFDYTAFESLQNLLSPGEPCAQTPASVKMWVKYAPVDGDSLMVIAFSKLNGQPVSFAMGTFGNTMSEYTQISVPFDDPFSSCDSVCVIIVSGGLSTNVNTTLIVDDVTLDFTVEPESVQDVNIPQVSVYPNPASNMLNIETEGVGAFDFQLFDLTGRLVAEQKDAVGKASMEVSELTQGVYMLKVIQNGKSAIQKVVVK